VHAGLDAEEGPLARRLGAGGRWRQQQKAAAEQQGGEVVGARRQGLGTKADRGYGERLGAKEARGSWERLAWGRP
jgi:hypothetical protein